MPEDAQTALCPHFGECGGCKSQDVPYAAQLAAKQAHLRELFAPFWDAPVPITPSPILWHYRNRLDLAFGRKQYPEPPPPDFPRETVLGFKRRGKWYWTLDIDTCLIGPEGLPELLGNVRGFVRERALTAYTSKKREGFLRILLVRQARRTGQRMVVLITNAGDLDRDGFVNAVRGAGGAASVYHGVFTRPAEITAADELHLLHGSPFIEEELRVPNDGGERVLRFRISPFSFFQTNTEATELLYARIRDHVRAIAPVRLYDLYGGSGGIAFTCADLVGDVVSVESVEEASRDGCYNAERNGVTNVSFHTAKVEHFLRGMLDGAGAMEPDAAVIVDPPRAGLHPKALKRLLRLRPADIVYVACQPKVFAKQDLPPMMEQYELAALDAVDLFPHTPHVEVLARLRAR